MSIFVTAAAVSASGQWLPSNNTSSTIDVYRTGKVGVGTGGSPLNQLYVLAPAATAAEGLSVDGSNNPAIILRWSADVMGYAPAIPTCSGCFFSDSNPGDLVYRSETKRILFGRGSGLSTLAVVGPKVGVGMSNPNYTLDVTGTGHFTGDVTVDGNIAAKFQDVAEWVPAASFIPAGTVVILSDKSANTVTPSTRAYDTSVAGVVSPAPGLLLGVESPSKAKVATTGRVRVRVDARNAAIRIGDLLVTSDRPGMAMKSEPLNIAGVAIHRPGTMIGKALEPLAAGEGEILVLLTLQ